MLVRGDTSHLELVREGGLEGESLGNGALVSQLIPLFAQESL